MDKISPERRSENMRRITSKDTAPEMIVRKLIYSLGYRYRLHKKELPGKPDLSFISKKKIIFVHGCFWHMHNNPNCSDARIPKTRSNYWIKKLTKNVERDKKQQIKLKNMGWDILIVWECETKDIKSLKRKIVSFLERKN